MASRALHGEDYAGLALAAALHAGLLALLIYQPGPARQLPAPERIAVTLSEETGLQSASPEPQAQAAPPAAPVIAPEPEPAPAPPGAAPPSQPLPKVQAEPVAAQVPRPAPRPIPKPKQRVAATPAPRPVAQPRPAPRPAAQNRPAPVQRAAPAPAARPAGGSRIADDFLKGVPGAQANAASRNPPAANIGPQIRASFAQSVLRQVRPNWQGRVPQGVNTEKLVTILAIELNRDGTLAKPPTIVGQEGIDDSNRAQAQRHAEAAMRAVQLSTPFQLPAEFYDTWKKLPPLRFRKST